MASKRLSPLQAHAVLAAALPDPTEEQAAALKAIKPKQRKATAAGKRFERRIATALRELLGEEWTVARNQTDRQKGQVEGCYGEFKIEHPELIFPFCIECKDGSGFQTRMLMQHPAPGPVSSTAKSEGHWTQAVRQAEAAGLRPLLICREPGSTYVYAALRMRDAVELVPAAHRGCWVRTMWEGEPIIVVRWETILNDSNIGDMLTKR